MFKLNTINRSNTLSLHHSSLRAIKVSIIGIGWLRHLFHPLRKSPYNYHLQLTIANRRQSSSCVKLKSTKVSLHFGGASSSKELTILDSCASSDYHKSTQSALQSIDSKCQDQQIYLTASTSIFYIHLSASF